MIRSSDQVRLNIEISRFHKLVRHRVVLRNFNFFFDCLQGLSFQELEVLVGFSKVIWESISFG
jgi:hypothetical protein